ncbi:DNA-directed RNA polymerase III subunit rpc3-like [Impatiens glandulifera]|uniref:DNA-directed RNA polymerase III subunit rpc3-like n=1 Tax=Impatiens glandulifera TaxID=253017 RepID=UPI001FB14827|nr:DNA-directed RNA polymerase III subunit rpc3-like [Impatiens glandulifera]
METPYGINLAVYLISTYFGDLVAKVCECLLRNGSLSFANILRSTELNRVQVKNSLLVLIQHNCVQAYVIQQEGGFGEAPKILTQYLALFDNIIHHLRFSKFLAIVSDDLGKECSDILEGLLQHGRLSEDQILDRYMDISNQNEAQDAIKENFRRLVGARYVERCPKPEPFLAPPSEEEVAAKKRRLGAKASKVQVLFQEPETIEQRVLAAAAPMDSIRFLLESFINDDNCMVDGERNEDNWMDGDKGRQNDQDLDMTTQAQKEKKVLWRVNFEEFVRRLRHKACVANVKGRLDEGTATVLSSILKATRSAETKVKMESSVPLSMDSILEEVIKTDKGRSMNVDRVRAALIQLGCQLPVIELDETFSIDLGAIIELAQLEEVESIVLKRYGREAYRMFRLLSKAGRPMETEKIADTTFVDKAETAKILLTLWKDDYLQMETLTANSGKETKYMVWKVNKDLLWIHVLDEMYHAALNLRLRLMREMEQEKEIILAPKGIQFEKRVDRLKKVRNVLESSLMKLVDATMLFRDF